MNSKQVYQALMSNKFTKKKFDGVFSKDNLEDIVVKPSLIICNSDPSNKPGEHWLMFYFEKDSVDFFDSLGKDLSFYGKPFVNLVKRYSHHVNKSNVRTQPKDSDLCGEYCLFYALCKVKHFEMEDILKALQKVSSADVVKTVKDNFEFCSNFECSLLQTCIKY